jgi:hypothetical protein
MRRSHYLRNCLNGLIDELLKTPIVFAQQCFTGLVATVSLNNRGLRRSTGSSLPRQLEAFTHQAANIATVLLRGSLPNPIVMPAPLATAA